jgi:phytoene dehydrogenase-like protein
MSKKIAIIGAGVAGLSAGCYARMNGYDTEIFEAQAQPGGLCTAWNRKGYVIDGCIHWLTGSGPGNSFYRIWQELGAINGITMYDHEVFATFRETDGTTFFMYTNVDRLERHMKEISPDDNDVIEELCGFIRRFSSFSMPTGKAPELMGFFDVLSLIVKMGPFMKNLAFLSGTTLAAYGSRFRSTILKEAITNVLFDEHIPLVALVTTLAAMNTKSAGYPMGGSLEWIRSVERRYLGLGGKIRYKARVKKITETNGKATGIELEDGSRISADYIVSAADMKTTLYSMLDGTRIDDIHSMLFRDPKLMSPCVQVSFGVDMDFSQYPDSGFETIRLEKPIETGGISIQWFNMKHYSFDPSMAPKNKSIVATFLPSSWEYWKRFASDRTAYNSEKEKIASMCAEQIEKMYPGFKSKIEITDIATPLTFERFTGNWRGSYMTWNLSSDFRKKYRYIPKTVPGLDNLWLASMWTNAPGGVPGAALAGKEVVQLICRKDKVRFKKTTK